MQDKNINLKSFIPHVGHTNLLYIASVVWFFCRRNAVVQGFYGRYDSFRVFIAEGGCGAVFGFSFL